MKYVEGLKKHLGAWRHLPHRLFLLDEANQKTKFELAEAEDRLQHAQKDLRKLLDEVREETEQNGKTSERLDNWLNDLSDKVDTAQLAPAASSGEAAAAPQLFAEEHSHDGFYKLFEDKFRGSEESVTERLEHYLPRFEELKKKDGVVLDIGCGRGELIQMLADHDVKAVGADLNARMVKICEEKGLDVRLADANELLKNNDIKNLHAVTGFHIVEHVPFGPLLTMFKNIFKALPKDGFVIFETPNPENLQIATKNFYMDPSHLNPVPPELLAFALEYAGFQDVEIDRLHPDKAKPDTKGMSKDAKAVVERFYTDQDYAVIGYKR